MTILLAPMEGLLDFTLRDILTRAGGIDRCVSEFIRVTGTLLPERVFYRVVPELYNGGRTPAGVPVRGQLMGSDAVCLAENTGRLGELGTTGVDLNFGCPAKVVNRHGGGAALLADPDLLHRIVRAVRRAVPSAVPVSAKMRLGIDDSSRAIECALAIQEAAYGPVSADVAIASRKAIDHHRGAGRRALPTDDPPERPVHDPAPVIESTSPMALPRSSQPARSEAPSSRMRRWFCICGSTRAMSSTSASSTNSTAARSRCRCSNSSL